MKEVTFKEQFLWGEWFLCGGGVSGLGNFRFRSSILFEHPIPIHNISVQIIYMRKVKQHLHV